MAQGRYDLTEFEWNVIKPLLPNKARGVPRVGPARAERYFLSAKVRFALGRFAREIWALHDGLQSLQPLAESRCLEQAHGCNHRGL